MTLENFRTQKIIWDRANKNIFEKIEANSGDSNGRKLVVQVINQGVTEVLSGTTLSLGWKSRKGAKGLDAFDVVDASKGIFEIYYTTEMLSNIGNIEASFILIDSTGRIESSTFTISVRPSTVDDASIESKNSFTALTEALVKVNDFSTQLAQTENKVTYLEKAKADNSRIDEIIVTPAEGISEQEIINARKGRASLRAKMDSVDSTLLENKMEFEYLYNSSPVESEWYQGSINNTDGYTDGAMVTDSRIRSYFIEVTPETDYFFRINEGFEFWIVEFRERSTLTIIPATVEYHTYTKHKTSPTANYIRIVVRRTGAPTHSSDPKDEIRPEDIVFTNLQVHNRSANDLMEMSENTDEMKNVNNYVNLEESDNVIELDVSTDRNFYVDIVDMVEKHVIIRGLHNVRGNMISRVLIVNALVSPRIKFPSNVDWQNDNFPSFLDGRTYMILLQSFNGGISWLGSIAPSWKNKEYLVYDDFDRPDQLGLGQAPTGQIWEYSPTSVWEIRDSSARVHTFRTDNDILSSDMAFCESGESNVRVSSVVEELSSKAIRLMVRVSDIRNYILVGRRVVGVEEHFGFFKMENGVQTELESAPLREPFVDGDTISVELEGNNIRVYHNGHFVVSTISSFNKDATKHGIISVRDKGRIFHNFSVEVI